MTVGGSRRRPGRDDAAAGLAATPTHAPGAAEDDYRRLLTSNAKACARLRAACQALRRNDTTPRAQAVHPAQHSKYVIAALRDYVCVIDRGYRYIDVNPAFLELVQWRRDDLVGRHVADVVGAERFAGSKPFFDAALAGRGCVRLNWGTYPRDEQSFVHIHYDPIVDDDGAVIGVVATGRDITAVKKAEQNLRLYRSVIDQVSDRILVVGTDYRFRLTNRSNLEFYRKPFDAFIGRSVADIIGADRFENGAKVALDRAFQGEKVTYDYWVEAPDGTQHFESVLMLPYREPDGEISGALVTIRDITGLKRAESEHERLIGAIETASDGYALYDKDQRLVLCNQHYSANIPEVQDILKPGVTFEALMRRRVELGHVPEALGQEDAWIARRLAQFRNANSVVEQQQRDGRWLQIRHSQTPAGETLLSTTDVTERKRMESALAVTQERFKDFAELAADWFWETDADLHFTYLSKQYAGIFGIASDQALGKTPAALFGAQLADNEQWRSHWRAMQRQRETQAEYPFQCADGTTRVIRSLAKPIHDAEGRFCGFRGVGKDITEAHRLAAELSFQAGHDELTGLVNRYTFKQRLEDALRDCKTRDSTAVLAFIDLDQFKIVNDTVGHAAGDQLLTRVAGVIADRVRRSDTIARLGGDEFGLLLVNCPLERGHEIAESLVDGLRQFRFVWDKRVFDISASIGLVRITAETESIEEAMSQADIACYTAKDLGRNRTHLYRQTDAELSRRRDELLRASGIRDALENDRFCLYAQPVAALGPDGLTVRHHELLLRMVDTDGRVLLPGAFIPAAERFGLMSALDRWVIHNALAGLHAHFGEHTDDLVALNLSGTSLNDRELLDFVQDELTASGVRPERLCFEITETAVIRNLHLAEDFVSAMKALGCSFALDDFGSGLSSFAYLKQFPVDYLKIDGCFVRDIATDPADHAMVAAINQVGKMLGIRTVAEFVETDAIIDVLREIGVDYVQGYAVGKPKPLAR